jgi:polyhydroxyalkanoic acid synthase PhaR subunit
MAGEPKAQETPADLWRGLNEAWKEFNESASRMWPQMPQGSQESAADPYGMFQSWKQWYDTATQGGENNSGDPFAIFKQWYDATSESWSKTIGEAIATEQFAEAINRFLDSYTSFAIMFRRANEQYFSNLQLPTRSDIARVASLIVNLEEKVDRIEDTLMDAKEDSFRPAADAALSKLEARLNHLESKLERVLAALEKMEAKEQVGSSSDQSEQEWDGILRAPRTRSTRASRQKAKGG